MAVTRQDVGNHITVVATEALIKNRFVDYAGAHTADGKIIGVALFDTDSGSAATVQHKGIAVVTSAGSVSAGNLVKSDANGKAAALTLSAAADAAKIAGVAMDAGATDGDLIRVILP